MECVTGAEGPVLLAFLSPIQILLVALIALLVFGPKGLPDVGKALGEALAAFRNAGDNFQKQLSQETASQTTAALPAPEPAEKSPAPAAAVAPEAGSEQAALSPAPGVEEKRA